MSYFIDDFWIPRLGSVVRPTPGPTLAGWSLEAGPNPSFVEAELRLRAGYEDLNSPLWFVAAPGAVGKSTLAREISARTGAIYLDLAGADTVAGNYLTGGLVKNRIHELWEDGRTTVLIDALDEARLRVTQSSFEDFLADLETSTRSRSLPAVLFGRVGIVEEAWLVLAESGLTCPILDIDFFDPERGRKFVMAALKRLASKPGAQDLGNRLASHESVYRGVISDFLTGLEQAAAADGARFAGYAPVLEAVATMLAGVANPSNLGDAVRDAMQGEVLLKLTDQILEREAAKLRTQLRDLIPADMTGRLYSPEEQLSRLASAVLESAAPPPRVALQPQYAASYDAAVSGLLPQHPFLDGTGRHASGIVFAAVINAHGLFSQEPETVRAAERRSGNGPNTPNPFLIEFYQRNASQKWGPNPVIPPEHVVLLYESIRARAAAQAIVRLAVEGDDEDDDAEVEIQIGRSGVELADHRILFRTSQAGQLRFGRRVDGVSVVAPQLDIVIGSGNPVEMVAPVYIEVARLFFNCSELVVLGGERNQTAGDSAVVVEAKELVESKLVGTPVIRDGAKFRVSWPGVSSYPWVHFAGEGTSDSADLDEALRNFRRLVLAFQSRSKGRLARFKDKIDHRRMTKGELGVKIRHRLIHDGILSLEGEWYFLDPEALGRIAGTYYQEIKLKTFSPLLRQYVSSIS